MHYVFSVYLWRKRAEQHWINAHEDLLQAHAHGQLVVVQNPGHKRRELEIMCRSRRDSSVLLKKFGGRIDTLPRNWLERFARGDSKQIKIGNRLVISNVEGTLASRLSRHKGRAHIIIPAPLAFGTGEHATTAMSLRFLEQLTRRWKCGWSFVDFGTGSGILALAAKRFGARRVVGIDSDPTAISMAKSNARLNKIRGARFQLADAHEWNRAQETDVITANLYSYLLIEILPKLRNASWLILSGILRSQQAELTRALHRSDYEIIGTKRRGKWVAMLARRTRTARPPYLPANFAVARDRRYSKPMQSEQLAYAIVTPYSMRKSRTGGIVGRLISRTGLDLVGGRMFAPGAGLTKRYADTIVTETDPSHRATQQLIREYVLKNFTGEKNGQHPRVLFLVFRGPDAVEKIHNVVGHILHERTSGETIRDTYGDYITDDSENVVYLEPGVVTEFDPDAVQRDLKLWAEFSDSDGGILERAVSYPAATQIEKTLVLIKPDNFRFPNLRPGGVIEVFSRTGLSIIGFKVHQMSVAQAEQFYGPVLSVLENKLGPKSGRENWESIIEFMAGKRPNECRPDERDAPGTEKSIAIVYQGVDAVRKIRDVLGPTDPAKAPPGSIRKEFGQTIMVNAAHASDSVENAKREMAIIRAEENNFKPLIENFYRRQ